ncbi:MAG: hypothetical protein KC910_08640 [Candidatus Eremiobacteraeota bacterium]|nr:hypothetical protein [Candidatus Eremiobacteraeota bacterium]
MSQNAQTLNAPVGAPAYLDELLARLLARTQAGDSLEAREAFRDTVGFLTRYFGTMAAASRGGLDTTVLRQWLSGKTTTDFRDEILAAIDSLAAPDQPVYNGLRQVFLPEEWGETYAHTQWMRGRWLLPSDPGWIEPALEMLTIWLKASRPFFEQCQHRYETLGSKVELATQYQGEWMRTGFPMRGRDLMRQPWRLDGADATYRPRLVLPIDTSGLSELVAELAGRQEQPGTVAESPEPETAELSFQVLDPRIATNKFGAPCYRGTLKIVEELARDVSVRLISGHLGLRFERSSFRGPLALVNYTLDPGFDEDELERLEVVAMVGQTSFRLPMARLLPPTSMSGLTPSKASLAVLAPGLLALIYLLVLHTATVLRIEHLLGPQTLAQVGRLTTGAELTLVELKALPAAQVCTFLFLLASVMAPLLSTKIFARVPERLRPQVGILYPVAMLLPTAGLLAMRGLGLMVTELTSHPEFYGLDFAWLLPWFASFNLVAGAYLFCSQEKLLDRWLSPEVRVLTPIGLMGLFLIWIGILAF